MFVYLIHSGVVVVSNVDTNNCMIHAAVTIKEHLLVYSSQSVAACRNGCIFPLVIMLVLLCTIIYSDSIIISLLLFFLQDLSGFDYN